MSISNNAVTKARKIMTSTLKLRARPAIASTTRNRRNGTPSPRKVPKKRRWKGVLGNRRALGDSVALVT